MNYLTIYSSAIADGPGIRVSLYVSGCHFHCKGCHNEISWNFDAGEPFTNDTLEQLMNYCDHDYIRGLSILGGEPLAEENRSQVLDIILEFKNRFPEKDIWMWTGYEFDELYNQLHKLSEDPFKKDYYTLYNIINNVDVMVIGRFILEKRDITANNLFRGSTNQRIIKVKESFERGEPIYVENLPNNGCILIHN